ncbi:cytochrome P450 [Candidatus Poriferisodalis sp.]|uniref:cytochrome P450 n=1 Tax=Candidatus Poriferisodalis sp. TaxID=3101277 RepID=UPI003B011423
MTDTAPVDDWDTDYDIFDPGYVRDPAPVWDELRGRCPIAHTERWGGSFLPTRYADVQALAKMVPELSSSDPLVTSPPPEVIEDLLADPTFEKYGTNAAPISEDPPVHGWTRRLLLPHFAPKAVESHRAYTTELANRLISEFIDDGKVDGAGQYAQQIPPRVIAHLLGIDESRVEEFTHWIRCLLELGLTNPELRIKYRKVIRQFFYEVVEERQANPDDGFVSALLAGTDDEGNPIDPVMVVGMLNLQLIAGIDTTWSSIGSALWHFGTHPADRERMAAEPDLWPSAIEELLRFYAPVTMGRRAATDIDYGGVTIPQGSKVLMNFPGANRDPEMFERPDEVILDRPHNRHVAFGVGIHRCAGSNLARMEMDIALRTWFERIPDFEVSEPHAVTWAGGQVRGPRYLPIQFPTAR